MVPQHPQKASRAMVPPPAIIRYVPISNKFEPTRTVTSRALYSVTSNHIPIPSTPNPKIYNETKDINKYNETIDVFWAIYFCCYLLHTCPCGFTRVSYSVSNVSLILNKILKP